MIYIKVSDCEGNLVRVDALEDPFFVYYENGILTRCREAVAVGMLLDSETVVNYGVGLGAELTAEQIPVAEYDTLQVDPPDPEDTEPEVPEDAPAGLELMTRAQLTAKVIEQENEIRDLNEQIDLLLSGVTEDETGA